MRWNPFARRSKTGSPITALKSASFLFGMGGWRGRISAASYDTLAGEGYALNAVVNACVNRICNSVASIDRKLFAKAADGKLDEIKQHALLDLLNKPNPTQSGDEFIRALIGYYLISGNAYVFGNGVFGNGTSIKGKPKAPSELQLFIPGKVRIEPGKALFPEYFEYKPAPGNTFIYPVDQVTGNSAILQLKTFNPSDQWYGLSPMLAAAYGIDIFNAGQKWNKKLLDNDCRPAGALVVNGSDGNPKELTDDQYQRLKEQIADQWTGAENAGKPMLLEGGLDWKQMSANPKDIDWSKGKNASALDICMAYGVPPQMIGLPGTQTFANYEQATLSFWTETIIPLHDWLQDALNRWLVPLFGDNLVLSYNHDSIAALEPLRKEKFTRVQGAEFMTLDEKRHAVGLDSFSADLGDSLLLTGRGVLLGRDGSVLALAINTNVDPHQDPLVDPNAVTQPPKSPAPPAAPAPDDAAKYRAWLKRNGYTTERAEHLTRLLYR